MWASIARFILRNRITIIIVLSVLTVFMGYYAQKAEIFYETPKLLPDKDTTALEYVQFKKLFGQDGSVMVIGIQDEGLYTTQRFGDWYDLGVAIKKVGGVKTVVSLAQLKKLIKNDSTQTFEYVPIITHKPQTQAEVDSIRLTIHSLPFYRGIIFNDSAHSTLMAITFDNKLLNTKNRFVIVDSIKIEVDKFLAKNNVEVHYSGMPYIRTSARHICNGHYFVYVFPLYVAGHIFVSGNNCWCYLVDWIPGINWI